MTIRFRKIVYAALGAFAPRTALTSGPNTDFGDCAEVTSGPRYDRNRTGAHAWSVGNSGTSLRAPAAAQPPARGGSEAAWLNA